MATHQTDGTADDWALEISQRIHVNEIKTVIQKAHSLHFNAQSAKADDVLNFSLENMITKFRNVTPRTWTLIQTLLDANGEAQRCARPLKAMIDYQKRHDPYEEPGELVNGEREVMSESGSKSKSESEGEGEEEDKNNCCT